MATSSKAQKAKEAKERAKAVKKTGIWGSVCSEFFSIGKSISAAMGELTKAGENESEEVRNFKRLFVENYDSVDRLVKQVPEAMDLFCELRGEENWPSNAAEMEGDALQDFENEGNLEAAVEAFL